MTRKQAADLFMSGGKLLVVEFRSSVVEEIRLTDKSSGKARVAIIIRHTVEAGPDSVAFTEWLPDGTDPKTVALPFKKGQTCLVHLEGLSREAGSWKGRGKLEALES